MCKLAPSDSAVRDYLFRRIPRSNILDCANAGPIQLFHLLLEHQDHIYVIAELDLMLVVAQVGVVLRVINVTAHQPVSFNQVAPYITAVFGEVVKIEFGFNPEGLNVDYDVKGSDLNLFVLGEFGMQKSIKLPELVIT